MKIKHIFSVFIACSLTACNLDIAPDSYIAGKFFFEDAQQVNVAVLGCYSGMQAPLETEWALTELRSDNTRLGKANTTTEANLQLLALDQGTMNSSNANIRTYWEAVYRNINNCNTVLTPQNLAVVEDPEVQAQYKREALFIRAYHYFNLVRLFGPVFLVTEEISVNESLKKDRSSVEQVYAQIIEDLKEACGLPQSYEKDDYGRATSLAAQSLLAKVYLTLQRYAEAKPLLEEVMAVKGETLIPYADIFDIKKEMNDEIIFAVRYKSGNLGIGSPFGNKFAPLNSGTCVILGSGDGQNYPTTELSGAYTPEDLRKAVNMADNYFDESKPNPIIAEAYIKKYLSAVSVRYDGENDWPVIRYADVLLMYAEVMNELSGPGAGLPRLNLVRQRAGLTALTLADVPNKYTFRQAIARERRLEFAFENQRWFDLLRWENAQETVENHIFKLEWGFYSTYPTEPNHIQRYQLILPIPQSVIDNNPGVITQNPNY